jgi:hypothetical protein
MLNHSIIRTLIERRDDRVMPLQYLKMTLGVYVA